jgi:hypothetical protein
LSRRAGQRGLRRKRSYRVRAHIQYHRRAARIVDGLAVCRPYTCPTRYRPNDFFDHTSGNIRRLGLKITQFYLFVPFFTSNGHFSTTTGTLTPHTRPTKPSEIHLLRHSTTIVRICGYLFYGGFSTNGRSILYPSLVGSAKLGLMA